MMSQNNNKLSSLKLSIGGELLYVDVDEFLNQVSIPTEDEDGNGSIEINLPRFEILKLMVDTTCSIVEDVDDKMGAVALTKLSIPYKLALNTLINYKIIKKL